MPEPLDPNKFHVISPKQKKIFGMLVALVIVLIPILSYFYYQLALTRPAQTDVEMNFEIKSGESVSEIASGLAKIGAINSEFLFNLYVFLNKLDRNIQAGVYKIPAGTNLVNLVTLFSHGVYDNQVTFIEGWRTEEYARLAAQKLSKIDYQDFLSKAKGHEGYLFPDTYTLPQNTNEEDLVKLLTDNFDSKTRDLLTAANLQKVGLTKAQVITLASIVEREAAKDEDRPIIAGILLKRFKEGMQLDADATTQYAVALNYLCGNVPITSCTPPLEEIYKFNWWPKDLTVDDLKSTSPYNTRNNVGLPPAPICNPGLASINAVVNYQPSDYYYYLNDPSGATHFAKTIEEHNANISKYLGL